MGQKWDSLKHVCSHVCCNVSPNSADMNMLTWGEVLALCSKPKDRRFLKRVSIYENAFINTSKGLCFLIFPSNVASITYYLLSFKGWIGPWKR